MSPFIKTGDIVTLSKIPSDKIKIGDIIFCRSDEGRFKLHRLIAIEKSRLITKGDALDAPDKPVHKTDCLGRVIRIERHRPQTVRTCNMETPLSQVINYILAVYYRYKSLLICTFINVKSHLNINRLNMPENS